ncbi:MAG: quinoprotein dehydrogenase-associated putative ABC transporter substrate-binding protein [Filomicrobium sp.]
MKRVSVLGLLVFATSVVAVPLTASAQVLDYSKEIDYEKLTPAEKSAARRAARKHKVDTLRVCADPGNMPLSNIKREGYQNKIAELLAKKIGGKASFFWRPYIERGLTRETFANRECDVLMGMPENYDDILTTQPLYRTTYVFASREERDITIKDFKDPQLRKLKIGVFQHSGIRELLTRYDIRGENVEVHTISQRADLVKEDQPWRQVKKVADGELDIAGVWGPFAGYVKTKLGAPLRLQPANKMDDSVPLEFSLSMGMRTTHILLKLKLEFAMQQSKDEIKAILEEYGVPLVQCSRCIVSGDIPSHGSFYKGFLETSQDRYLKPIPKEQIALDESKASKDQIVDRERLEAWLEDGADLDVELANATTASDANRIRFLLEKGAKPDKLDNLGYAPIHNAARYRDSEMVELLASLGANVDVKDHNGWTPLMHAAFRNHVPTIETLVRAGAKIEEKTPLGFTALALAIGERKFWSVQALLEQGAAINQPMGEDQLTPLMLLSTQVPAKKREAQIDQGPGVLDVARQLINEGADVNARSNAGVTPVMIAAGHNNPSMLGLLVQNGADLNAKSDVGKTPLMIANDSNSDAAIQAIKLFSLAGGNGQGSRVR